jgi:hypothetical protein
MGWTRGAQLEDPALIRLFPQSAIPELSIHDIAPVNSQAPETVAFLDAIKRYQSLAMQICFLPSRGPGASRKAASPRPTPEIFG